MPRDWEQTFSTWARPPGETEQAKIENAIRGVRSALGANAFLRANTLVYVQGSYRNRVNVRQDSDVDIGVLYTGESFGVAYPDDVNDASTGNVDSVYTQPEFKDQVGAALVAHFGAAAVSRGNKAFDIHANTYRIDADVVPTFIHRRYVDRFSYVCGVQLLPDSGGRIVNWPERLYDDPSWPNQHYENAVAKNTATNRNFKAVVRVLKSLRNEMDAAGNGPAKNVYGFFIECLVWNVPNNYLQGDSWDKIIQSTLAFLWGATKDSTECSEWGEVSEWKYVFKHDEVKREKAFRFIDAAWDYVGIRQ